MEENQNYTPLNTDRLTAKKKPVKLSNKMLIGLILFFAIGVGALGFLLTRERIKTRVPAQIGTTVTVTPVPSPSGTVTLTVTPVPISGEPTLTATTAATTETEPTTPPVETNTPAPTPTEEETVTSIPTSTSAPIGGNSAVNPTATPTEIVLVQATATPGETGAVESTKNPEIPSAGTAKYSLVFALISLTVIFLGLIL